MRRMVILGALAGLALLCALVAWQGWRDVAHALAHAGWPLLLLVPVRLATLALDAWAWRILLLPACAAAAETASATAPGAAPLRPPGLPFLLWIAAVREAINRLLPAAGVGGEVVGVRLARLRVPDTAGVAASVIVEVLITITALYLTCGLALVLIANIAARTDQVQVIATGMLLSLPLPLLCWWLLRGGTAFRRLERWAVRLFGARALAALSVDGAALDAAVVRLLGQPERLLRALGWQLLSYLACSFETWYALRLLGHPVDVPTTIAIEALTQASRQASALVPAGLGVQEAATILFAHLAGVDAALALSLALTKRLREIMLGGPALLSWQWFEAGRWRRSRVTAPRCAPPGT